MGGRVLRSFDVPIEVYEFVAEREDDDRLPAALAMAAADPLVGRRAELARLGSLLADVTRQSRTVFIVGEPGIGKTRLAAAVAADAVGGGCSVLYGRCEEGLAAPYQPVIEAFGPWLAACPDAALARLLGEGVADFVHLWPQLASRLEVTGRPPAQDPEAQRWRVLQAVAALWGRSPGERPPGPAIRISAIQAHGTWEEANLERQHAAVRVGS